MGIGSSTLYLQRGDTYAARAKAARKLADDILTVFFSTADFKDILELSSLQACPKYVFTTAEALQSLFDKIAIQPKLGKKGEILFAPLARLAPGVGQKTGEAAKAAQDQVRQRDTMCMDIAYFYVRIFQIYGALAMTVLEADPTRIASYVAPKGYGIKAPAQKPGTALFVGGGLPTQVGGSMIKNPAWSRTLKATVLNPLIKYFTPKGTGTPQSVGPSTPPIYLELEDKRPNLLGTFYIVWDKEPQYTDDEITLKTRYTYNQGKVLNEEYEVRFKRRAQYIDMYLGEGDPIQTFVKAASGDFYEVVTGAAGLEKEEIDFKDGIHSFFESRQPAITEDAKTRARPGAATAPARAVAGTYSAPSTVKSAFEGFEGLKKLLEDRANNKDFPKAYCVARAMVLLNPLFENERRNPMQPYVSQVCRRQYDFEVIPDLMPRPGRQPKANTYLKSLVALYYDAYQIKGSTVEFTQTETGRTELREASKDLAALYNVSKEPETFIESSTEFKQFPICSRSGMPSDVFLYIKDENMRRSLQNDVIRPMLQFQQDHTNKVNGLLKKMFEVKPGKDGRPMMKFSKELKSGGIESVNKFAREARDLLLTYYLKSEAWFIKGTLLLESGIVGGKVAPVP